MYELDFVVTESEAQYYANRVLIIVLRHNASHLLVVLCDSSGSTSTPPVGLGTESPPCPPMWKTNGNSLLAVRAPRRIYNFSKSKQINSKAIIVWAGMIYDLF